MTAGKVTIPNIDRLSDGALFERGLARLREVYEASPPEAVILIGDIVSVLMTMTHGVAGGAINPVGVLIAVGCLSEKDWPEGRARLREAWGAWQSKVPQ